MKKLILLAVVTIFGVTTANAQVDKKSAKKSLSAKKVETPKVEGAGMVFENETLDFGTIPHNSDGNREFVFVNNGTKALSIESTQGSCGCTVPTKPEGEIAPGGKGTIGVHYDTARPGVFTKTVTVRSNAIGQEIKVLTIKGNVLPAPATEGTAPVKS